MLKLWKRCSMSLLPHPLRVIIVWILSLLTCCTTTHWWSCALSTMFFVRCCCSLSLLFVGICIGACISKWSHGACCFCWWWQWLPLIFVMSVDLVLISFGDNAALTIAREAFDLPDHFSLLRCGDGNIIACWRQSLSLAASSWLSCTASLALLLLL